MHCSRYTQAADSGRSFWSRVRAATRCERGQSMAMAAITLVAILGLAALMVDGGMTYTQRRVAQNAADAGAFAGALKVGGGASDGQVRAAVQEYVTTRNKARLVTAAYLPSGTAVGGGSVPADTNAVRVTDQITFTTFFAAFLGFPVVTVGAEATASFGPTTLPGPSVQPLARRCGKPKLEECGLEYGKTYDIWQGEAPGNKGWLSWSGGTSSEYVEKMLTPGNQADYIDPHGACSTLEVGCWVQGGPGTKTSGGINSQLNKWIEMGKSGEPMIVIVYDESEDSGSNANYRIAGFAAFVLESYDLPEGHGGEVRGKFIKWLTSAPVDDSGGHYGISSVHLSR